MIKCPLCGGIMRLTIFETTSWFQCEEDPTHRMALDEYGKEGAVKAMEERRIILATQSIQEQAAH